MPKVLLHCCCAVCASHPYFSLKDLGYDVVLYFFNPNIYPFEEYQRRLDELKNFSKINNANLIIEEEPYETWLEYIKGFENEPEKGERCSLCFEKRLQKSADAASKNNCDCFTTTLTISPHKNSKQIFRIGNEIAAKKDMQFLQIDFKKQNGFLKTSKYADEYGFYRQQYCGCEFSIRKG